MAEKSTSQFEKMGDDILGSVVNISGQRTPYTMPVMKPGYGKNPTPPSSGEGTRANRSQNSVLIRNAHGPKPRIVSTICYPNSDEQGKVYRNVYKVGNSKQFGGARGAAGNTGNV